MPYNKKKFEYVMKEFGKGQLNSGRSKKKVKNRKQAVAIAYSEARKAALKRMGGK